MRPDAFRLEGRQERHRYPVTVGHRLVKEVAALCTGRDRVALVSAAPVLESPFGRDVVRALSRARGQLLLHVLPDGEAGKTLRSLQDAANHLLTSQATRKSLIVGMGGGAVTDAAGFLAAIFMRGLDWVAVPTTLLGMVDAALGGKTAVNLPVAKNALGAFHPPVSVVADLESLHSLPLRELRSGFGEALKYAALQPRLLRLARSMAHGGTVDARFVAACAKMKLAVVHRDPREQGERKLLNLGHTFGHAVEAAGKFSRYTHGEAVAVGTAFAFRLAHHMGRISMAAVETIERALVAGGLPVRVPPPTARAALELLSYDKKRDAAGLRWVLPREHGKSWRVEWDILVDPSVMAMAMRDIERKAKS